MIASESEVCLMAVAKLQNMILEVGCEDPRPKHTKQPSRHRRTSSEPDMYHLEARMDSHDAKRKNLRSS